MLFDHLRLNQDPTAGRQAVTCSGLSLVKQQWHFLTGLSSYVSCMPSTLEAGAVNQLVQCKDCAGSCDTQGHCHPQSWHDPL
jgi:hypothetical protein